LRCPAAQNLRLSASFLPAFPAIPAPTPAQGATASLRSKLGLAPLLHSATARYSQRGGLQLSAKSRFGDGTKVKTSYDLPTDTLTVAGGLQLVLVVLGLLLRVLV
jgi:hypothetical protein